MNSVKFTNWAAAAQPFLYFSVGGVKVLTLLLAVLVICFTFVFLLSLRRLLKSYLGAWAARTSSQLDGLAVDLIASIRTSVLRSEQTAHCLGY